MTNPFIPTPESLSLGLESDEDPIEQSGVALLELELQRHLIALNDCEKVLDKISLALDSWTPNDKILEVKIHKGQMLYSHNLVTERLNDKGWEIEEPYQSLGLSSDFILLKLYPNHKSRDILRSIGHDIDERDYPKNNWLSILARRFAYSDAINRASLNVCVDEYEAYKAKNRLQRGVGT